MDLPAGYQLRAPTPDDLEPAGAVLIADDLDDAGQVVLDADFLRGQWDRLGFDLATDAWVAVDDAGTIVGTGRSCARSRTSSSPGGSCIPSTADAGSAPHC